MLIKKKQYQKIYIYKQCFYNNELTKLLLNSIQRNQELMPKRRYIFFKTLSRNLLYPFLTKQRLHCFLTFTNRVPSSK